jgi:hypothetical protein
LGKGSHIAYQIITQREAPEIQTTPVSSFFAQRGVIFTADKLCIDCDLEAMTMMKRICTFESG